MEMWKRITFATLVMGGMYFALDYDYKRRVKEREQEHSNPRYSLALISYPQGEVGVQLRDSRNGEVLFSADTTTNQTGVQSISQTLKEKLGGEVIVERLNRTKVPESRTY